MCSNAAVHVVRVMIFPRTMRYAASPRKIYKSSAIVGEVAEGIVPKSVFVLLLGFSVLDMLLRILGVLYRFTHCN